METATSLVITQLAQYLQGLTQRLDPGAGWYGEFLRRDPEGVRACLDGAAIPPWDVVESLLRDLAEARGAQTAAQETPYAARLRAAAVTAWDALPGGAEELRTLLAASAAQRAEAQAALRNLTARLGGAVDRAEADALARELSWTQDDVARAAARHEDLSSRLSALPAGPAGPWPAGPAGPAATAAEVPEEALPGVPRQREVEAEPPVGRAEGRWLRGARRSGGARYAGSAAPDAPAFTPPPGGPVDAGPEPDAESGLPAPRGARFGRPDPVVTAPRGARFGGQGARRSRPGAKPGAEAGAGAAHHPVPPAGARTGAHAGHLAGQPAGPSAGTDADARARTAAATPVRTPEGATRAAVARLLTLRAQGRSGEAHALLCEAAAWPAERLPALAAELGRAGLAADWATLLWEAASLPPERLAAAAAALGEAGRDADCDRLLRQGVSRPTAEIADAALALGGAGHDREADALLGAFVRVRTAEEAASMARRAPQWFAPRLLRAARALSGSRHRDLVHALRVAGIAGA
uniref:UL36 very large tegument protein n=1 Tax=Streptomyces sp. NBC_00049 TaxID=2903617 RepID=A0AAU2JYV9_9ACTN